MGSDQTGVDPLRLLGNGRGDDVAWLDTAHEFGTGRRRRYRDAGDGDRGHNGYPDNTRASPGDAAQCNIGKASIE